MVKNIKSLSLLFLSLFCLQPLSVFCQEQSLKDIFATSQPESAILLQLCKKQIDLANDCLMEKMDHLLNEQDYWNSIKTPSFKQITWHISSFLTPSSSKKNIDECLAFLDKEIKETANILGGLHEFMHTFKATIAADQLLPFLQNVTNFIAINLKYTSNTEINHESNASSQLYIMMVQNIKETKYFRKRMFEELKPYTKPNHLARNWPSYLIVGSGLLCAALYYKKNNTYIKKLVSESPDAIKNSFTNYIYKPIRNSLKILFNNTNPELSQEEKIYFTMQVKYLTDRNSKLSTSAQLSNDTIIKIAKDATKQNILPEIIDNDYCKESENPILNSILPSGKMARLMLLRGQQKILSLTKIVSQQQLNLEIAKVAIPTAVSLSSIGWLLKKLWVKETVVYKPIQHALGEIERILNVHNSATVKMDHTAHGYCYYWLHKLNKYTPFIPHEHRPAFARDLQELSEPTMEIQQKLRTLDRMYRTYEFLTNGSLKKA